MLIATETTVLLKD